MDSLPTAHLFKAPWSETIFPVNDLSWSMWGVWSCFYDDTIETAVNEDTIITNDMRAIKEGHKKGKYILGGLSDGVARKTMDRGHAAMKELVRSACLDFHVGDLTASLMWLRDAAQDGGGDIASKAVIEWMLNPNLRGLWDHAPVEAPLVSDNREPGWTPHGLRVHRRLLEWCAETHALDGDAEVGEDGSQESCNDRGFDADGIENCRLEGGGDPTPYLAGVREAAAVGRLDMSSRVVAAFAAAALGEGFNGEPQTLGAEDFPATVEQYSKSPDVLVIVRTMEDRPWEQMPEDWAQMLDGDGAKNWHGHPETLQQVTDIILARGIGTPRTPLSPAVLAQGARQSSDPEGSRQDESSSSDDESLADRQLRLGSDKGERSKGRKEAAQRKMVLQIAAGRGKASAVGASPPDTAQGGKRASSSRASPPRGRTKKKRGGKTGKVSALSTSTHEQNPGMCLACHPDNCDLTHSECDNRLKSWLAAPGAVHWMKAGKASTPERGLFATDFVQARTWIDSFGPMQWAPGAALVNANGYRQRFRVESKLGQTVKWGTPKPGWASFHTAPYINHTCCELCRNCEWWPDDHGETFNVLTTRVLRRGEELLANYVTGESTPFSQHFRRLFNVACACCACRRATPHCKALAARPSARLQHVSKH